MALPDLIEIVPLTAPVRAEITVPGSKSITNRALILAALAEGTVTLTGALWSEDTEIMFDCLRKLGFEVSQQRDPNEPCNRTITVQGHGGAVPHGGTEAQPLDLFVGNAGTAARFLAPFLCLGSGVYRLHGVPRMHERPQAALFLALRELGYRVEAEQGNDKLPVKIWGKAESGNQKAETRCTVSIVESSQFASALLLSSTIGGWTIEIAGENADESPYVVMTAKLMEAFPNEGGTFQIEPDASSGSYFIAASKLAPRKTPDDEKTRTEFASRMTALIRKKNKDSNAEWRQAAATGNLVRFWKEMLKLAEVEDQILAASIKEMIANNSVIGALHWPKTKWQIDAAFPEYIFAKKNPKEIFSISRKDDLADSIMTAIVVAPFENCESIFTDLGRLRVQECERVVALRTELTQCGAKVEEAGDTLTVWPATLHGAEIETYHDHRMAMCFAILGLKVPGIRIKNPACVKKTFPNFFQKLAGAPPHGLGAEIWEIKDGRRTRPLSGDDLFAD